MKDLIDEIAAARRTVGSGHLPAGDARVIAVERTYPAAIDDVWDALTNPERIARWFVPVSGDLRAGGSYELEDSTRGEIRTCEPPNRLVVTWILGEPTGPEDFSIVDVQLRAAPDGATVLELEHTAVVPQEFWDGFGPGAVGVGWDVSLVGLAAHLSGFDLGDPATLESDPAMRNAMVASSEAWGRALESSEIAPDAATVARFVAATTAFYVPPLD